MAKQNHRPQPQSLSLQSLVGRISNELIREIFASSSLAQSRADQKVVLDRLERLLEDQLPAEFLSPREQQVLVNKAKKFKKQGLRLKYFLAEPGLPLLTYLLSRRIVPSQMIPVKMDPQAVSEIVGLARASLKSGFSPQHSSALESRLQCFKLGTISVSQKNGRLRRLELTRFSGLVKTYGTDFCRWILEQAEARQVSTRERNEICEILLKVICDADPERTLKLTRTNPFPFTKEEIFIDPKTPKECWHELAQASQFWPENLREKALSLGLGKNSLPNWNHIVRFFETIGLKAVPVLGFVGPGIYNRLLGTGRIPVCTYWLQRYRKSISFIAPVDVFHDLGHGLAMGMDDYRKYAISFSKAALKNGGYMGSYELHLIYVRHFELSHAKTVSEGIEPIGSAAVGLDITRVRNRKLELIWHGDPLVAVREGARKKQFCFDSRRDWAVQTRREIRKLQQRSVK